MKRNSIREMAQELKEHRRDMHKNPQTAYEETFASNLVAQKLEEWGIPYERGFGKTGIVAHIQGQKNTSGRKIGLRGDMDALDIEEKSGQPWHSKNPGKMHACGHDGHTTILLGAARYLNETRNFDGTVHLIFQPAEEGRKGAKAMMEDGLFEKYPCDEIYGLHNWPWLECGKMAIREKNFFAASDTLHLELEGKGGHAAFPHQTNDPMIAATQIVQSLQMIISREIDPTDTAVISVTNLNVGTGATNIISDTACLSASIRSFREDTRSYIHSRIEQIIRNLANAYQMSVKNLVLDRVIDPTYNDPMATNHVVKAGQKIMGEDNVITDHDLIMGGEDFGAFCAHIPGAYFLLGQKDPKNENSPHNYGLHSPYYDFNDDIIADGMEIFAQIIEQGMPLGK